MAMEEQLVARLIRPASAVVSVVGNRVNWLERPTGETLPSVTLQVASGGEAYNHEARQDLSYARLQVDCWGKSYLSAKQVARSVISELEQPFENEAISFDEALVINDFDRRPETLTGGTRVFSVLLEFDLPYTLKGI